MSIKTKETYGAVVIELHGKFLGSLHGSELKQTLNELKEAGKTHVVIDLAKTDFMDSSGVGALIAGHTSMHKVGGDIRLANLQKRIRNLFMMTHLLGPVFDSFESLDEAIQSFQDDPPAPAPTDAA